MMANNAPIPLDGRSTSVGGQNDQVAEATQKKFPHNIEAEQALLGALLINNDAIDRVPFLTTEHFYDPVHGRIFNVAKLRHGRGQLVTPLTLKSVMEGDEGLEALGGVHYLKQLTDSATAVFAVKDYAETIYELALRRMLIEVGEDVAATAFDPTVEKPPLDQISEAEDKLYRLAETGRAEGGFQSFRKALVEAIDSASAAYQRDGKLSGISTGLRDLDEKLGGLHKSDLLILAGRPSMGKTALVTNVAFNVAKAYRRGVKPNGEIGALSGGIVAFFSLEMSAEQLASRILSEQAEVPSEKIRRGDMDEDEFRRLAVTARELEKAPLFIDDTPALPIATLAARARRLKRQQGGLDLIVIDYLQLCRGSAKSGDNRVQEVSEITQGLKAMAKDLDVPVIALSQLSRKVEEREDKRPQLSDLRESGSIEQDADAVMFVFREEYYVGRTEPGEGTPEHIDWRQRMDDVMNMAEVVIGKQRHGPIGIVKLMFDSRFTRFGDLAPGDRGYAQD